MRSTTAVKREAGQSEGLGEGPREQQPATDGRSPEQHAGSGMIPAVQCGGLVSRLLGLTAGFQLSPTSQQDSVLVQWTPVVNPHVFPSGHRIENTPLVFLSTLAVPFLVRSG